MTVGHELEKITESILEAKSNTIIERNKTHIDSNTSLPRGGIAHSEQDLRRTMEQHRLNSWDGEITSYLRIKNTNLSAGEVAEVN